jgi:hypothetical protein
MTGFFMQLLRFVKFNPLLLVLGLSLSLLKGSAVSQTLSLPPTLTSLTSTQGERLLRESQAQVDFIPLHSQYCDGAQCSGR